MKKGLGRTSLDAAPTRGCSNRRPSYNALMTQEEIEQSLLEKAERRFGKSRADELRPDIEQTAAELLKIYEHPLGVEDEP